MLKRLKLEYELKQKRESLKTFLEKRTGFTERRDNLRTALSEAETEEDIELVNNQIKELEEEIGDVDYDAEIQALNTRCDEIEDELKKLDEKIDAAGSGNPNPAPETENNNERKADFSKMRTRSIFYRQDFETRKRIISDAETRSLVENVRSILEKRAVSGVEYNIPPVLLDLIKTRIEEKSQLLKFVKVETRSGDARIPIMGVEPEAIWVESTSAIEELDLGFSQIEIGDFKVAGFIPLANCYIKDSDETLISKIIEAIAKSIAKAIDKAIVYGTGKGMPTGIITRLAQTAKPDSWSEKEPEWKNLSETNILTKDLKSSKGAAFFSEITTISGIPADEYADEDSMFWIMNRKTAIDFNSKAIAYDSAAVLQAHATKEMPVVGGSIVKLPFMADGDVLCGYGSLYQMLEREEISLGKSEHVRYLADQTVFAGKARYDGKPVFGEGFVLFNIYNKTPKTSETFAKKKGEVQGEAVA